MKRLPILLFLVFFWSCDEDRISFSEPQPANVNSDEDIREKFQGQYFCDQDSTWLIIKAKSIVEQTRPFDFDVSGDHVKVTSDKETQIRSDFGKDSAISMKVKIDADDIGDSINIKGDVEERIFDMKRGDVARFFRGYYFLNIPLEDGDGYKVRILRKTHEGVLFCRIGSDSLLKLLEDEEFVEHRTSDDSDQWRLSPSRKELKRLINRGLFSNVRAYRRIEE